jgi:hypothetical protein
MVAATDRGLEAIRRAAPLFERVAKETRLLDTLQWGRAVEERFFAAKGRELPQPEYKVDRDRATNNAIALDELAMTLDVADPIQRWVTQVARSYADGNRLLLAIGTPRFHAMSVDVYGGPRSWFDADSTNLDLANHLAQRLEGELAADDGGKEEKSASIAKPSRVRSRRRAKASGSPSTCWSTTRSRPRSWPA